MNDSGLLYLTAECCWHDDELLSCLDDIKPQDIEVFIRQMFAYFYVDSLMYGNLTENQSIEYMIMFQQKFHQNHLFQPIYPSMWFNHRQLMLPEGCNYAYTMLNDGHCTEAITIYLQCFQQTLENNALIDVFAQLISEPCFEQLRTKEQLGYIVSAKIFSAYGAQGLQITVQSTFGLDHVNRRIERFLDSIRDYIEQMSEEDFQKQREGQIMKNMEIPKRMTSQGNTFWFEISRHEFCFDRREI
ncbi:unnamed protein product [Rotaria sordida]|nr:unnamed protein product [Rotaria sordida]